VSGVNVLFTVGLSAWLGGRPPAPSVVAPQAAATAAEAPATVAEAAPEGDDEADDSPAGATAEQTDPNWVEIKLPKQRRLYLQKTQHPERMSASVRLVEPRAQWARVGCAQISVPDGGGPQELHETGRVENGEQHSVSGKIALRELTLLATSAARVQPRVGSQRQVTPGNPGIPRRPRHEPPNHRRGSRRAGQARRRRARRRNCSAERRSGRPHATGIRLTRALSLSLRHEDFSASFAPPV
jgi:hypothetical protein